MMGLSFGCFGLVMPKIIIDNFQRIILFPSLNYTECNNLSKNVSINIETNIFVNNMKYIFCIANFINGVSSVALYTIAVSFLENIFEKGQVNIRQGLYYIIGAVGIGVGALVSGYFLKVKDIVRNSNNLANKNINNSGTMTGVIIFFALYYFLKVSLKCIIKKAWWIIYCIGSALFLFLSIFFFRFSSAFNVRNVSSGTNDQEKSKIDLKYHAKTLTTKLKLILNNRAILFILMCTTCETFILKGFSSYLTTYLEFEYRISASTAALIQGSLVLIGVIGGGFIGAFLVKHFKWSIIQNIRFVLVVLFVTIPFFVALLLYCPQETYINSQNILYNKHRCNCEDIYSFTPVCYKDEFLFQTPCHAGCSFSSLENKYSNCIILDELIGLHSNDSVSLLEKCSEPAHNCMSNLIYVCLTCLCILFLSSLVVMPKIRILLESVDVENQSFILGIRSFVSKLFGNNSF